MELINSVTQGPEQGSEVSLRLGSLIPKQLCRELCQASPKADSRQAQRVEPTPCQVVTLSSGVYGMEEWRYESERFAAKLVKTTDLQSHSRSRARAGSTFEGDVFGDWICCVASDGLAWFISFSVDLFFRMVMLMERSFAIPHDRAPSIHKTLVPWECPAHCTLPTERATNRLPLDFVSHGSGKQFSANTFQLSYAEIC